MKYLDNENLDVVILTAQILTTQKLYIFDKEKITNTNNKNFQNFHLSLLMMVEIKII